VVSVAGISLGSGGSPPAKLSCVYHKVPEFTPLDNSLALYPGSKAESGSISLTFFRLLHTRYAATTAISTAKTAPIEIPTVFPSEGDAEDALFEDCCKTPPVDVGEVVDVDMMPGDVTGVVALWLDDAVVVVSWLDDAVVVVVWLDDMLLLVTKLKPLTGIAKIVADAVITTVAVNSSGSAWLLRNVIVWPLLTVDIH